MSPVVFAAPKVLIHLAGKSKPKFRRTTPGGVTSLSKSIMKLSASVLRVLVSLDRRSAAEGGHFRHVSGLVTRFLKT